MCTIGIFDLIPVVKIVWSALNWHIPLDMRGNLENKILDEDFDLNDDDDVLVKMTKLMDQNSKTVADLFPLFGMHVYREAFYIISLGRCVHPKFDEYFGKFLSANKQLIVRANALTTELDSFVCAIQACLFNEKHNNGIVSVLLTGLHVHVNFNLPNNVAIDCSLCNDGIYSCSVTIQNPNLSISSTFSVCESCAKLIEVIFAIKSFKNNINAKALQFVNGVDDTTSLPSVKISKIFKDTTFRAECHSMFQEFRKFLCASADYLH